MKIALVTDSTCDIPFELVNRYQIHVVPNILIMDGRSVEDNREFSRQDFYEQLPELASFPTTSTSSVGTYLSLYENLIQEGFDQIISIHCSSQLSGIFNAASTAAQSVPAHIKVVDSQQVSLGLGFQVLEAVEAIAKGISLDSILLLLEQARERVRLIAMLDTLEFVQRSGRVSWARASLGALLNLRAFVEVRDGYVHNLGQVRTRKKGITRLLKMMQSPEPLKRFALLHTNAKDDAYKLLETLAPKVATPPLVVNATTVIGTHVGPNGLGFVALFDDKSSP